MKVSRDEKLTHFINDRDDYYKDTLKPKYRAFIPQTKSPEEISVYRISSLIGEDSKVWEIGKKYVKGPREIIARADFMADVVCKFNHKYGLEVVPDTRDHELHANIKPIPLNKEDRDVILRELALASGKIIMRPEDT